MSFGDESMHTMSPTSHRLHELEPTATQIIRPLCVPEKQGPVDKSESEPSTISFPFRIYCISIEKPIPEEVSQKSDLA
jgi:hypothetical protein